MAEPLQSARQLRLHLEGKDSAAKALHRRPFAVQRQRQAGQLPAQAVPPALQASGQLRVIGLLPLPGRQVPELQLRLCKRGGATTGVGLVEGGELRQHYLVEGHSVEDDVVEAQVEPVVVDAEAHQARADEAIAGQVVGHPGLVLDQPHGLRLTLLRRQMAQVGQRDLDWPGW